MTGRCLTKHAPIACDGFYLSALLTLWRGQNAPPLCVRAEELQPLLFRHTRRCESQGAEKRRAYENYNARCSMRVKLLELRGWA